MSRTPLAISLCLLSCLLVIVISGKYIKTIIERFDSGGALMQLAADHVPTEEDVKGLRAYRRQVSQDLIDMTGSA
jgi:hypothetical protein